MCPSLLFQWWLFAGYVQREVAPVYPAYWDQTVALQIAYEGYEDARTRGLSSALRIAAAKQNPPGALLPLAAVVSFVAFGPSRLHALALNFAAFALLQVGVVLVLRRLAGWPAALTGWGLTWALRTTYLQVGGIVDFRADFAALCLYALFLGVALWDGVFASARGSALAGLAAGVCVSTRFLTLVYLGTVLALFAAVMFVRTRRPEGRDRQAARSRGAVLAAVVMVGASAPALFAQRHAIADHYFRGILGPLRAVRAQVVGADHLLGNLTLYPYALLGHTGPILPAVAAACALALAFERTGRTERPGDDGFLGAAGLLLTLAFVVPLVILTSLTSKSIVVGSILAAPLLWAVPLCAAEVARLRALRRPQDGRRWLTALAVAIALAGAVVQYKAWRMRPLPMDRQEVAGVFALHDALAADAWARGTRAPIVSVDHVSDPLNAWATNVSTYERHRRLLQARPGLGAGIGAVAPDGALDLARASDYLILTSPGSGARKLYPADESLEAVRPALYAYCDGEMRLAGRFRIPGREVALFARR